MDFVSKTFSLSSNCIVIGEIGVNHNRDEVILFRLIDEGIEAGLDIIKFQRFKASEEITKTAATALYQKNAGVGDSQLEMAKKLELPDEMLVRAYEYCKKRKVGFLCTAFDHSSVDFVADVLQCKTVKVASPDITNRPLIEYMAKKFDSLIVSSGASFLAECVRAMDWIRGIGHREIAFLHCLSQYPAPIEQANLIALKTMRATLNVPVGYSDHTQGIVAGIVAASLGATLLEKHYTLDKNLPGPDHKASSDISELSQLVRSVKEVVHSLGDGVKRPMPAEQENLHLIRKSFTCAPPTIAEGTIIRPEMLGIKRPCHEGAVEPFDLDKIQGLKICRPKKFDEPILWSDFKE